MLGYSIVRAKSRTLSCSYFFLHSKTVWLEQCSCTLWTGKCHNLLRATLQALLSSKWMEMLKNLLCFALLFVVKQEERSKT